MGSKGKGFRNKDGDDIHGTHRVVVWVEENGMH